MKNERLLQAIGKIDDNLVYDAAPPEKKAKRIGWIKWGAAAACLVFVAAIYYVGISPLPISEQPPVTAEPPISVTPDLIQVNTLKEYPATARLDVKSVEHDYTDFSIAGTIRFPDDLTNVQGYAVYSKPQTAEKDASAEYSVLSHYILQATNLDGDRFVMLKFSADGEPVSCYAFPEGEASTIQGHEVTIYEYENAYMAEFTFDGNSFQVESTGLAEDEFVKMLSAIFEPQPENSDGATWK